MGDEEGSSYDADFSTSYFLTLPPPKLALPPDGPKSPMRAGLFIAFDKAAPKSNEDSDSSSFDFTLDLPSPG